MTNRPPASPACHLAEAPDAYRGYLAPAEIAAVLQAAARVAPAPLAGHLTALAAGLPAAAPCPAGFAAESADALLDRLLPRIRDDALHARLRALRAGLQA